MRDWLTQHIVFVGVILVGAGGELIVFLIKEVTH